MDLIELTLSTLSENLALDEALLEQAEKTAEPTALLRIWELSRPAVVIGRSSSAAEEVDLAYCREHSIEVGRRCSGGAAVVVGPGCLIYSLVLGFARFPGIEMIDTAHQLVLRTIANGLRPLVQGLECQGTSDMTCCDRKFSGNSLRMKRTHLLYHGTILYDFPLPLISACLGTAPRQPKYRVGRAHSDFVCNLQVSRTALREALHTAWGVSSVRSSWPQEETAALVESRYARDSWTFSR